MKEAKKISKIHCSEGHNHSSASIDTCNLMPYGEKKKKISSSVKKRKKVKQNTDSMNPTSS